MSLPQPEPVKTTIRRYSHERLKLIAGPPDFHFDVERRVYLSDRLDENVTCPSISFVERTARCERDTSQGWHWTVLFNVGYIFEFNEDDDGRANDLCDLFETDIWNGLGREHELEAFTYATDATPQERRGVFWFEPAGTGRNITEPIAGRLHAQLDVHCHFFTSWDDLRRI